jgi:hypothetical protein
MTTNQQLMAFRTAYLQTLALCWNDKKIREKVVSHEGICKNILEMDIFKEYLPNKTPLEWRTNVAIIQAPEKVPVRYSPFEVSSYNSWIGGADVLVIKIPECPNDGQDLLALTSYYSLFPTFLGNDTCTSQTNVLNERPYEQVKKWAEDFVMNTNYIKHINDSNILNDLGFENGNPMFDFGAIMQIIIAECWSDKYFYNYITNSDLKDPHREQFVVSPMGADNSTFPTNGSVLFKNPWAFSVRFEKPKKGNTKWDSASQQWTKVENNEIYLMYPEFDIHDDTIATGGLKFSPLALSKYNNTGPAYPFTCI